MKRLDLYGPSPDDRNQEWCTPTDVLAPVYSMMGAVDLDPCSNGKSIVGASETYDLDRKEDGLILPWRGRVYCNPPFNDLRSWTAKAVYECRRGGGVEEILMLIPVRPDTRAWHESVVTAPRLCMWKGRIRFLGAKDPIKFPVAMVYWGDRVERFERMFGPYGAVYSQPVPVVHIAA